MSKKNVVAFLAGLGSGYLKNAQYEDEKARQGKIDARAQESHDAQMDEAKAKKATRAALAEAGREPKVEEGAGGMLKPQTMDNRDVGLPENATLPNNGMEATPFRVEGKPVATRAEADTAVASFKTPEARTKRVAAALYGAGEPAQAMQLEQGAKQAQLADLQLAQAKWKQDIGKAMSQGHDGIAKLVSDSDGDGLADRKVTAVVSTDGKMVTYHEVKEDGKTVPLPQFTFANTKEGVTQAGYMLDQAITPEQRYSHMQTEQQRLQAQANADRTFNEGTRQFDVNKKLQEQQIGISAGHLKLAKEKLDTDLKNDPFRNIPAGVKAQATSLSKQIETINTAITNATVKGELNIEAAKPLLEKQAALTIQYNALLKPYTGGVEAADGKADPLGIRGKQPATAETKAIEAAPAGSVTLEGGKYVPTKKAAAPNAASAGVMDPANPLSVVAANNAKHKTAPAPTAEEFAAQRAEEEARRKAWLAGGTNAAARGIQ